MSFLSIMIFFIIYYSMSLNDYFINLPESLLCQIHEVYYPENKIIIEQSSISKYIYWIKKGLAKAYHVNERGQEFLFEIFGKDELVGEVEFFSGTEYLASVETVTDCQLVQIPYDVFREILNNNLKLFYEIGKTITRRFTKITERTVEFSYYPLEYLITKYLVNEADSKGSDTIITSKETLANYFGTNQRSINRILKKLTDDGIIAINKNEVKIISLVKLTSIYKSY